MPRTGVGFWVCLVLGVGSIEFGMWGLGFASYWSSEEGFSFWSFPKRSRDWIMYAGMVPGEGTSV